MDKRKKRISILAGILALTLALGLVAGFLPTSAGAATSGELKQQLNSLKQDHSNLKAEIKSLKKQISANSSKIEQMVAEKDLLDQEIFLLYQQIENVNSQIATYSLLIADKQEELVAAEARFQELTEQYKSRIRAMEEEGDVSYWSVLFQANNFADLLDRFNMIQEIAAADRRHMEELSAAAQVVADAKTELQEEKQGLEESRATLDQTQKELEGKREEADALLVELVAQGMEYETLMEQSEDAEAQLLLEIASKQNQYDAAVYREWLATSVPPTTKPKPPKETEPTTKPTATTPTEPDATTKPTEGKEETPTTKPTEPEATEPKETTPAKVTWKLPIRYKLFTSPFGWRKDPVTGKKTFHYGVDLAADKGTKIVASRAGTVSAATYDKTMGYYVQIDHGDGFKSVYLHMTHYVVKKGQHVTQGQVIGYCGSTGKSTGPHLHFGISKNGEYVNPAGYIPI